MLSRWLSSILTGSLLFATACLRSKHDLHRRSVLPAPHSDEQNLHLPQPCWSRQASTASCQSSHELSALGQVGPFVDNTSFPIRSATGRRFLAMFYPVWLAG